MKPMKSILLFLVGLTLTATQAMAATYTVYGQQNVTPLYMDINSVTVSDGLVGSTPTWDIVMSVAGDLSDPGNINNQYNVNFASTPGSVFSGAGHGLTPPAGTKEVVAVTFNFNPANPTNFIFGTLGGLTLLQSGVNGNSLNWSIDKSSITTPFWFGGQTIDLSTAVIDHTNISSTNTPIPGAAWLLGSGVLGLFGLKRKKDEFAM